jgi:ABC-type phosphate transport system substrate-binding protein
MKKTIFLMMVIGFVLTGGAASSFADVVVVVNKANSVTTVKKSVLGRYFLKKTTSWESGTPVVPVDLPATDPLREEFSGWILKMSPKNVEGHWITESLTGGKAAPEIVNSGTLVKKRVASEPGGVGYIDSAEVDGSVKVIEVVE